MQEGQKPKDPTHTMQWLLFVRSHIGQNLLNHFALSSPFPYRGQDEEGCGGRFVGEAKRASELLKGKGEDTAN